MNEEKERKEDEFKDEELECTVADNLQDIFEKIFD